MESTNNSSNSSRNNSSSNGVVLRKRRLEESESSNPINNPISNPINNTSSNSNSNNSGNSNNNNSDGEEQGWRVKLYRLNADGSWDDCGTGRILCVYKNGTSQNNVNKEGPSSPPPTLDQIYQELGEPTLCVHTELHSRVLLRTRVLLRDAYQRQGDNIITWCEPYYEETNPTSPNAQVNAAQLDGPHPQGVSETPFDFICALSLSHLNCFIISQRLTF